MIATLANLAALLNRELADINWVWFLPAGARPWFSARSRVNRPVPSRSGAASVAQRLPRQTPAGGRAPVRGAHCVRRCQQLEIVIPLRRGGEDHQGAGHRQSNFNF